MNQYKLQKAKLVVKPPQQGLNSYKKSPRVISKIPPLPPTKIEIQEPKVENSNGLFQGPIKPAYVFMNFSAYLTNEEQSEILQYKEIYYLRDKKPPKLHRPKFVTSPKFFSFTANDHIAYRYQQLQVLGKGSFGSVIKCFDHKTQQFVAVKMMRDHPKEHSQLLFELQILQNLQPTIRNGETTNSHHIIKLIESFIFRGFFCIVMELMGPDLYNSLKMQRFIGFDAHTLQVIASQTADALALIHSKGIIHCDIKPENILFTDTCAKQGSHDEIRVIDYGCSCYDGHILFSYIQSRFYRAPEVVLGCEYSTPIDIWSLGCVLCELVTGKPLFPAQDERELIHMIAAMIGLPDPALYQQAPRVRYYFDHEGKLLVSPAPGKELRLPGSTSLQRETKIADPEFLDLISGCLLWDPSKRFTASEIQNHQWTIKQFKYPVYVPFCARK